MNHILLPAILLTLLATSCGESAPAIQTSMSGAEASTGNVAVSGGGHQSGPGVRTLFYGTAMERGTRRFTYLVAGPIGAVGNEYQDSTTGATSMNSDVISSVHSLEVNGVKLSANFAATYDHASNAILNPTLALQGESVAAEDNWFYLFDWGNADSTPRAVAVEMPELPADKDELPGFTKKFVTELMLTNGEVREFVKD